MRFYCHITKKPNSVIERVMDGLKVVSQKRVCVFIDGQLDTDDPDVIKKLKARPDLFWVGRADVHYRALSYPELVYEAERLGIKTNGVGKRDLLKTLINYERDRGTIKKKAPKTIVEIKKEAKQAMAKAEEEAALIMSMQSVEDIEDGLEEEKGVI